MVLGRAHKEAEVSSVCDGATSRTWGAKRGKGGGGGVGLCFAVGGLGFRIDELGFTIVVSLLPRFSAPPNPKLQVHSAKLAFHHFGRLATITDVVRIWCGLGSN